MRYQDIIIEAGVKTSEVDQAAREAIVKHLPDVAKAIRQAADASIGAYDAEADVDFEERHRYYDRLYDWFRDNPESVITPICIEVSRALTEVLREMGNARKIGSHTARNYFVVSVEAREYSTDKHKDWNGYHNSSDQIVKVFIKGDLAAGAAIGIIQEDLFGEQQENYREQFLNLIVPTFCHEYTHFEQNLQHKRPARSDLGYITLGAKRERTAGKRHGKRGGWRRDTNGTETYLRYISSLKEIDAWASGAASELVQNTIRSYSNPQVSNQQIQDLRQSVAMGWSDAQSLNNYRNHYYNALEGNYPGLNQQEMTQVWHRFLKLLYSKLGDYLTVTVGKAAVGAKLDPHWVERAQKTPTAAMIAFLARVVARRLLNDDKYHNPERIVADVERGYGGTPQNKGEDFIRAYYFGNDWYDHEDRYDRYVAVFRRLIKKTIADYLADET